MAIDALGYGGLYSNYKVTDIPKVDIETVKKQDELAKQAETALPIENQVNVPEIETPKASEDNRSRIANLEDISLNFNAGDDFSYIGSGSDTGFMDMQKAISDMRKDKILEDYQYFVGSAKDLKDTFANDDGKVFLKF